MTRILVTGGAGFIGSNFVRRTLETRRVTEITVLDSLTYAGRLSNFEGVEGKFEFVHGDICNKELVDDLVADCDLVVNFAAESHNDNSLVNPEPFVESNIKGTFELIQACVRHSKRFHQISTDEVFGDLPVHSKKRFSLESPYNPSSPYSASKAAADHLVRSWVRSFGLAGTVSICSNNFGPYQHPEKLIPLTILLAAAGTRPRVYGNGTNVRDWIFVDDHTDGVWAILERGKIGSTYLLGSNSERSNIQVVEAILKVLGLPSDFIEFVPDRPGHDLRYALDASKTIDELGWHPTSLKFEERLPAVIDHYLSNYSAIQDLAALQPRTLGSASI